MCRAMGGPLVIHGFSCYSSVGCAASGEVVVVGRQRASRAPDRRMLGKELCYVKNNRAVSESDYWIIRKRVSFI
jgi:hypothetical protein